MVYFCRRSIKAKTGLGGKKFFLSTDILRIVFLIQSINETVPGNMKMPAGAPGRFPNPPGGKKSISGDEINTPGDEINIPETKMNIPGVEINRPDTVENIPGDGINIPGALLNTPGHEMNNPGGFASNCGGVLDRPGAILDILGDASNTAFLAIAQPFKAGMRARQEKKSRKGRKRRSSVPAGTGLKSANPTHG